MAHVGETAAIHQVDDEFELVKHLEVGEFGLIAGLNERFKACFDQGAGSSAEDSLFAEEVGFGFFGEGGFEHARASAANAFGVTERERECVAAGVLFDSDETGDAAPFGEDLADPVAGAFRSDERDVSRGWRRDGSEANVEPVGEHERNVGLHVGDDLGVVDLGGGLVGREVHDDVRPFADFGYCVDN